MQATLSPKKLNMTTYKHVYCITSCQAMYLARTYNKNRSKEMFRDKIAFSGDSGVEKEGDNNNRRRGR